LNYIWDIASLLPIKKEIQVVVVANFALLNMKVYGFYYIELAELAELANLMSVFN